MRKKIFLQPRCSRGCSTNSAIMEEVSESPSSSQCLYGTAMPKQLRMLPLIFCTGFCTFKSQLILQSHLLKGGVILVDFAHLWEIASGIQNTQGHQNDIIGSEVTATLLKRFVLPIGRVASGRVCVQPAKQASLAKSQGFLDNSLIFTNFVNYQNIV